MTQAHDHEVHVVLKVRSGTDDIEQIQDNVIGLIGAFTLPDDTVSGEIHTMGREGSYIVGSEVGVPGAGDITANLMEYLQSYCDDGTECASEWALDWAGEAYGGWCVTFTTRTNPDSGIWVSTDHQFFGLTITEALRKAVDSVAENMPLPAERDEALEEALVWVDEIHVFNQALDAKPQEP